jgi:transcription initiation factor TFIID subunit 2
MDFGTIKGKLKE